MHLGDGHWRRKKGLPPLRLPPRTSYSTISRQHDLVAAVSKRGSCVRISSATARLSLVPNVASP
eukprot:4434170-Karenia_brevis.AAC.1